MTLSAFGLIPPGSPHLLDAGIDLSVMKMRPAGAQGQTRGSPLLKRDGRWGSRAVLADPGAGLWLSLSVVSTELGPAWARGAGSRVFSTGALGGRGRHQMQKAVQILGLPSSHNARQPTLLLTPTLETH